MPYWKLMLLRVNPQLAFGFAQAVESHISSGYLEQGVCYIETCRTEDPTSEMLWRACHVVALC